MIAADALPVDPLLRAALGAGAGLVAGSFLATLVVRWPDGRGLGGRSVCDGCGRSLRATELVPLMSYLAARGRCRSCAAKIDPRHPLIEAGCALLGALACAAQPGLAGLAGALFGWLLLTLAWLDAENFWLPDALTLPLIGLGLAAALVGHPPFVDRLTGAAAGWASLAGLALVYRRLRGREGMGGGDPKLFAALGAWLGWAALPFVATLAGVLGLVTLAIRRLQGRPVAWDARLPLGTLLAAAGWLIWLTWPGPLSSI